MKFYIGVDDAGRGPVIGAMLMAGVLANDIQKKKLKRMGCKDSKQLTREKRTELHDKIKNVSSGYSIVATSPNEIDGRASVGLDLNKIEAIKTAEIINTLIKNSETLLKNQEIEIYVDCPSPNTVSWQNYLARHINKFESISITLKCEHKADINHVECSAASILAKVTRDSEIDKIKKQIGIDFGSGYPSDEKTVEFLEKHARNFKNDGIFRKTWATWQENERKREQKKLDGF